ncbi:hypothetical protein [Heyndrickxia acidicola]|uniref:Uncharacterized protein n=1 Tax=Heyndrickxia acidicola TaxID=209389 RepID=A0ABU6MKW9_9BACI|nr:hypothetical protein [Heyndrickxia acidicola]MED1204944.1 hypothetical protein [Heyndrickxia acidicola]
MTSIRRAGMKVCYFNLLDGLAYDLEPMGPGARQIEKRRDTAYRRPALGAKP